MGTENIIERLRRKPLHQRERLAKIATGVSFLVILFIWMFSFSEMNRSFEKARNDSARENLRDLGSGISEGKKSIEEMLGDMPDMSESGMGAEESLPQNQSDEDIMEQQEDSFSGSQEEIRDIFPGMQKNAPENDQQ